MYQPASRYWALQGYETAIFLALAVILGAFALVDAQSHLVRHQCGWGFGGWHQIPIRCHI